MGIYSSNGMGLIPLSFTEIKSYNDLIGANLSPSEIMIIRKMSQIYVSQVQDKRPFCKSPFTDNV